MHIRLISINMLLLEFLFSSRLFENVGSGLYNKLIHTIVSETK